MSWLCNGFAGMYISIILLLQILLQMEDPRVCGGLVEVVKSSILALSEINVKFERHLEVIGSIHIRSDNNNILSFMLDEHAFKERNEHGQGDASTEKVHQNTDCHENGFYKENGEIDHEEFSAEKNGLSDETDVEENNNELRDVEVIQRQRFPIDHRIDKRSRNKIRQNLSPRFHAILNSTCNNSETLDLRTHKECEVKENSDLVIADIENDVFNSQEVSVESTGDVEGSPQETVNKRSDDFRACHSPQSGVKDVTTVKTEPLENTLTDEAASHNSIIYDTITPNQQSLTASTNMTMPLLVMPFKSETLTDWQVPQVSTWLQNNVSGLYTSNKYSPGGVNGDITLPVSPELGQNFDCPFCGMVLANRNNLKNHINSVHTHSKSYVCHICGKVYYSNSALNIHRRRNHYTIGKRYKCLACGKFFKIKSDLSAHMCEVHSRQKEQESMNLLGVEKTNRKQSPRKRKGSFTSIDSDLSSDEVLHRTKSRLDIAELTDTDSGNKDTLVSGKNTDLSESEQITVLCSDKKVESPTDLYQTEAVGIVTLSQSESEPESESSLTPSKKQRVRSGGYPCSLCDSQLSSKHNLQVHIKSVHIRDRIYSCEHCGKTSYSQSAIRIHRSRHHGNGKACKCEVCGAKFKIASDLAAHLNRKHQIFSKK